MIYLLYGNDTNKARKKLHELLDLAEKKRPNSEVFKITTENWSEGQIDELLISQGLFEQKYTVVLDNLFEKKEIKEYILDRINKIAESEQIFLMLESKVDVNILKKIEKVAKQCQEFVKPETKKQELNLFSVADGLVSRDKKKLWISYLDLLDKGGVPEEIHGIFFWQIKSMLIVSKVGSQDKTGLSPYVYRNALLGSKRYKIEELIEMSSSLVEMTHKVRNGEGDLEITLEKWILERH